MEASERALQIWSVLVFAAKHRQVLTYDILSKLIGVPMPGEGFIAAQDIPKTQIQVFAFDWFTCGALSPEILKEAVNKMPSNGIRRP